MKINTAREARVMIDNTSLNVYHPQSNEEAIPKKKGKIELDTHDYLLASNKLLNI